VKSASSSSSSAAKPAVITTTTAAAAAAATAPVSVPEKPQSTVDAMIELQQSRLAVVKPVAPAKSVPPPAAFAKKPVESCIATKSLSSEERLFEMEAMFDAKYAAKCAEMEMELAKEKAKTEKEAKRANLYAELAALGNP